MSDPQSELVAMSKVRLVRFVYWWQQLLRKEKSGLWPIEVKNTWIELKTKPFLLTWHSRNRTVFKTLASARVRCHQWALQRTKFQTTASLDVRQSPPVGVGLHSQWWTMSAIFLQTSYFNEPRYCAESIRAPVRTSGSCMVYFSLETTEGYEIWTHSFQPLVGAVFYSVYL